MIPIFLFLLVFAILLRIFTPKKPNYFFGYQLGSANKSVEHWKMANIYASNYMIVVYSLILGVSIMFNYLKYDGEILLLALFGIGIVTMYFYIENKLKRIN